MRCRVRKRQENGVGESEGRRIAGGINLVIGLRVFNQRDDEVIVCRRVSIKCVQIIQCEIRGPAVGGDLIGIVSTGYSR